MYGEFLRLIMRGFDRPLLLLHTKDADFLSK